ncbi:MAG: hypothetical protein AVDCRST_MAG30-501 [uncultured Solirubrobacteraceae bacterium]|uniref:Uncharacterized protein n=1 Tax=uncultured Solirubrobacteraceae bacterium TaxID=1162706 RepID=A0A6J4RMQ7_9ACTN|nr:MAG: hypothetical protein AVDCRST_MAG30-501 [uncultured Solirubrobacteraceae bacterium]
MRRDVVGEAHGRVGRRAPRGVHPLEGLPGRSTAGPRPAAGVRLVLHHEVDAEGVHAAHVVLRGVRARVRAGRQVPVDEGGQARGEADPRARPRQRVGRHVVDAVGPGRRPVAQLELLLDRRERDLLVLRDDVAQRPRPLAAHLARPPQEDLVEDRVRRRDVDRRRRGRQVGVPEGRDLARVGRLAERRLVVRAEDVDAVAAGHVGERLHPPAGEGVRGGHEGVRHRAHGREASAVGGHLPGVARAHGAERPERRARRALLLARRAARAGEGVARGAPARPGRDGGQADVLVERDDVRAARREPRDDPLADQALDLRAEGGVARDVAHVLLELHGEHPRRRGAARPVVGLDGLERAVRARRPARLRRRRIGDRRLLARRLGERAPRHLRVVGDQLVDPRRARRADLGGRVEGEGDDAQAAGVGVGHELGREARAELRRDVLEAARLGGGGGPGVERSEREQRGLHGGQPPLGRLEVLRVEGLHEQLAAREPRGLDDREDVIGVPRPRPRLVVGVRREVLDLQVDAGAGAPHDLERLLERRDRLLRRGGGRLLVVRAEDVEAALAQLGERLGADRPGAGRRAVEQVVVDDDGPAVGGELDVELDDEPVAPGALEGGERVLRQGGNAVRQRAAAVGVHDRGRLRRGRGQGEAREDDRGQPLHAASVLLPAGPRRRYNLSQPD